MGTIRKIQQGADPLNSASVVNRPHEDILSISDYPTDGTSFNGFAQGMRGNGSPRSANSGAGLAAPKGTLYHDKTATDGRHTWIKAGAGDRQWVRVHDQVAAITFVTGAVDGATDNGADLASADAAAAAAGVKLYLNPYGTYYIATDRTFSADWIIPKGAVVKRAASATVTINGHWDAGEYQTLDDSAGGVGKFDFAQNIYIEFFRARWWGIKGDGVSIDDGPFQSMVNQVPDFSDVVFARGMRPVLTTTIKKWQKYGVHWLGGKRSLGRQDPTEKSVTILWRGADGGIVFEYARCAYGTTRGIGINCNPDSIAGGGADAAIVFDMRDAAGTQIGSQEICELMYVKAGDRSTFIAFSIAPYVGVPGFHDDANEEYLRFIDCTVEGTAKQWHNPTQTPLRFGYTSYNPTVTGSMTSGGNVLTVANKNLVPQAAFEAMNGLRIRIARAKGTGPDGLAGQLDTTVTGVNYAAGTLTLADTASASVTGACFMAGYNRGIAWGFGPSFNAKAIKIIRCNANYLETAIYSHGGSFIGEDNSWSDNECNIVIDGNQSEPSCDIRVNSEQSRQHLRHNNSSPFTMSVGVGRLAMDAVAPSKGYIELQSQCAHVLSDAMQFDNPPPTGSYIFDTSQSAVKLWLRATRSTGFNVDRTLGTVDHVGFLKAKGSHCVIENDSWKDPSGTAGEDYHLYGDLDGGNPKHFTEAIQHGFTPTSEPADADFYRVGQFADYLDDAAKLIKRKVRYGDGTFRKHFQPKGGLAGNVGYGGGDTIAAGGSKTFTITVTGAVNTDAVVASFEGSMDAGLYMVARVTAADTVKVWVINPTGAGILLFNGVFRVLTFALA